MIGLILIVTIILIAINQYYNQRKQNHQQYNQGIQNIIALTALGFCLLSFIISGYTVVMFTYQTIEIHLQNDRLAMLGGIVAAWSMIAILQCITTINGIKPMPENTTSRNIVKGLAVIGIILLSLTLIAQLL